MNRVYDLAIIGGGAAGLMAAAWISEKYRDSESRPSVVLLEKMPRCGRKINITGKGRCNLTNTRMWDEFSPHVHPNSQFFKNAFYNFSSHDTMDFFKSIGLELSVERGQRVYPKSMRAMEGFHIVDLIGLSRAVGRRHRFTTQSSCRRNGNEMAMRLLLKQMEERVNDVCSTHHIGVKRRAFQCVVKRGVNLARSRADYG